MPKRHRSHYETSGGMVTEETCYMRIMEDYDDLMDHMLMLAHLRADSDPLLATGFKALAEMNKLIKERFRIMATGRLSRDVLADLARKLS